MTWKKYVSYAIVAITVIMILTPFVWWVANPSFSQMQVFLKWWHVYIIGIIAAMFGFYLSIEKE